MAELRPVRGLRYRLAGAAAGSVLAPPYDVISADLQAALYAASDYNVIRLEYGKEAGEARYQAAAAALTAWQQAGVLAAEEAPAVYVYEQRFQQGGQSWRRRAVIGRVRLEEFATGVIRPHEYTMSGPKADRLALLTATQANISPVFGLMDDSAGALATALDAVSGAPALDADDITGQRHTLTVITDADQLAAFARALAGQTIYIADGHHRYETALNYRAQARAAAASWTGDEPENFVLMAIAATNDPGLLILPIHRLIGPRAVPADFAERLAASFDVTDIGAAADPGAAERLVARLAAAGAATNAYGVVGLAPGRLHLLTLRDRAAVAARVPAGHPEAWQRLDVNVLQFGVLEPLLGIDAAALTAGAVEYSEDAGEAIAAVQHGHAPLAFLLNATRAADIVAVAGAGDRMPQKSTYFYPKLGTGLVMYSHRAG